MAIPVIVKAGGIAWLLWELFRDRGKPAPPTQKPPENPVVKEPETTVPARPVATPCAGPVLGRRWRLCDDGGHAIRGTTSQGDYDALYHPTTKHLVAVVDNTTYDDSGESAYVVATVPYASKVTGQVTNAADPNGLPLGYNVLPGRVGVPMFKFKLVDLS